MLYASFLKRAAAAGIVEFHFHAETTVGICTVWKKSGGQRLIVDARLSNARSGEPDTVHLATGQVSRVVWRARIYCNFEYLRPFRGAG